MKAPTGENGWFALTGGGSMNSGRLGFRISGTDINSWVASLAGNPNRLDKVHKYTHSFEVNEELP